MLLLRPTLLSISFSFGEQMRRRTSAVFNRSISTKESLAPFMDFSSVGSEMEREMNKGVTDAVSKLVVGECIRNDGAGGGRCGPGGIGAVPETAAGGNEPVGRIAEQKQVW